MDKVKITREQADEIVKNRNVSSDLNTVMMHIEYGNDYNAIKNIDTETLIKALYIGYEIEETPEDKVKSLYVKLLKTDENDLYSTGMIAGIKQTLDALNIKIEGVNA